MTWKEAKVVMLRRSNQLNYMKVKLYGVISLLNCLGKACEDVVEDML